MKDISIEKLKEILCYQEIDESGSLVEGLSNKDRAYILSKVNLELSKDEFVSGVSFAEALNYMRDGYACTFDEKMYRVNSSGILMEFRDGGYYDAIPNVKLFEKNKWELYRDSNGNLVKTEKKFSKEDIMYKLNYAYNNNIANTSHDIECFINVFKTTDILDD